ncbi:MAG: PepSY domain-containing protein [Deltaproteobacteria bacterium]|nr:PepSY domain-containing protein [Deltaproteobacteria bacterium]
MNFITYFQFNLLILAIFGIFVISCFSQNTCVLPESAIIHYAKNGTPSYIKGANLSSHLDDDHHFRGLKQKGLYGDMVYQFLQSWRRLLKIDDPRREFEITGDTIDELGFKHVNLQQVLNGITIWGRSMSVHLNENNQVYLLQGYYEPTLKNVDITPNLSVQEAAEKAISEAPDDKGGWRAEEKKLFILMVGPQNPRLVYRIKLVRGLTHREYYFADAKDGKILHKLSGTPNQNSLSLPIRE